MTLGAWIGATRPRTLGAAVVPVAVGLALAADAGRLRPAVGILTLVVAVLIQVTTNLANDYFDAVHGADGPDRLGPPRLSAGSPAAARQMYAGMLVAGATAAALGSILVAIGGVPILLIGAAALVAAVAYTGGPYPLAYHGWGDAFVLVFFGPVAVLGTLLLQGAPVDGRAVAAAIAVGALATTLLVVNNVRDVASDARAGKRTLAVRWGVPAMHRWYAALGAAAFASAFVAVGPIVLLALPLGVLETARLRQRTGGALNASLAGSARLHLLTGALLVASVLG